MRSSVQCRDSEACIKARPGRQHGVGWWLSGMVATGVAWEGCDGLQGWLTAWRGVAACGSMGCVLVWDGG